MDVYNALQLNEEELYELIGRDLSTELGLGESDPEQYRNRARRWFKKNQKQLRERVCNSQVATLVFAQDREWDQTLLTAAVADLVSSVLIGISPVTVSALLVKEGLIRFCETIDE